MPARYAVIGYPVKHSWSPFIHGLFAKQTDQDMTYRLMEVAPEDFRKEVFGFFASGGSGLNVTLPHKPAAAALADQLTPRAELAGAVNTLLQKDGLLGDNTDGVGLVNDLTLNLGFPLRDQKVLLLGAGGAARGVIAPLLSAGVTSIHVANRNPARAIELAGQFKAKGDVQGSAFVDVDGSYDLILNATSASLQSDVPPIPTSVISAKTLCYDMAYGKGDTAFTLWAKGYGAALAETGWGMLVEQAAESFFLWRGVRPQTKPVLEALKAQGNVNRES